MGYCLEDVKESNRLEEQNAQGLYDIEQELRQVSFEGVENVLDAGCGTGFVTRKLLDLFPNLEVSGVDLGIDRLKEAEKLTADENKKAKFYEGSLYGLPFEDNSFDLVISRFVFHHLQDHQKAMDELYRVVRPGGKVVIIDSDGIMFNFYSSDQELMGLLAKLESNIDLDFYSARKLKSFMSTSGGKDLSSSITPMHFKGPDLTFEREQYRQRFEIMKEEIEGYMGAEDGQRFMELFLQALDDENGAKGTEMFYSRFITQGIK